MSEPKKPQDPGAPATPAALNIPFVLPLDGPVAALRAAAIPSPEELTARAARPGPVPEKGLSRSELAARVIAKGGKSVEKGAISGAEGRGAGVAVETLGRITSAAGFDLQLRAMPRGWATPFEAVAKRFGVAPAQLEMPILFAGLHVLDVLPRPTAKEIGVLQAPRDIDEATQLGAELASAFATLDAQASDQVKALALRRIDEATFGSDRQERTADQVAAGVEEARVLLGLEGAALGVIEGIKRRNYLFAEVARAMFGPSGSPRDLEEIAAGARRAQELLGGEANAYGILSVIERYRARTAAPDRYEPRPEHRMHVALCAALGEAGATKDQAIDALVEALVESQRARMRLAEIAPPDAMRFLIPAEANIEALGPDGERRPLFVGSTATDEPVDAARKFISMTRLPTIDPKKLAAWLSSGPLPPIKDVAAAITAVATGAKPTEEQLARVSDPNLRRCLSIGDHDDPCGPGCVMDIGEASPVVQNTSHEHYKTFDPGIDLRPAPAGRIFEVGPISMEGHLVIQRAKAASIQITPDPADATCARVELDFYQPSPLAEVRGPIFPERMSELADELAKGEPPIVPMHGRGARAAQEKLVETVHEHVERHGFDVPDVGPGVDEAIRRAADTTGVPVVSDRERGIARAAWRTICLALVSAKAITLVKSEAAITDGTADRIGSIADVRDLALRTFGPRVRDILAPRVVEVLDGKASPGELPEPHDLDAWLATPPPAAPRPHGREIPPPIGNAAPRGPWSRRGRS